MNAGEIRRSSNCEITERSEISEGSELNEGGESAERT
jgi:hypothetical protein